MGLEVNAFVADVEHVFRISIPDEVAIKISTPRELARFIADQLPEADRGPVAEIEEAGVALARGARRSSAGSHS
jgi:hypothetical protein